MSIKDQLKNRYTKEQTLFRIVNGEGKYILNGLEVSEKELDEMFPCPLIERKENPDKRTAWMAGRKSF